MLDPRAYFYDTIADRFDDLSNPYDTQRRLEIVFDELLGAADLTGRSVLDVGCGSGRFSARAAARGARVTALDIGVRLLQRTRQRCPARPVAADACLLPFRSGSFDVVIASECIEHTTDPLHAVEEIHRVTRPGGRFLITVPNQLWHFAATFAATFKLRPFEGYENWVRWRQLREAIETLGAEIEAMRGFHLVPPVVRASWPLLRRADALGTALGPVMLNIALLARRPPITQPQAAGRPPA
jgi:2-polyprenyl-6-hydroxyphenyl methylase/3-demethylubiquinone-9 3-methyltransferase